MKKEKVEDEAAPDPFPLLSPSRPLWTLLRRQRGFKQPAPEYGRSLPSSRAFLRPDQRAEQMQDWMYLHKGRRNGPRSNTILFWGVHGGKNYVFWSGGRQLLNRGTRRSAVSFDIRIAHHAPSVWLNSIWHIFARATRICRSLLIIYWARDIRRTGIFYLTPSCPLFQQIII